MLFQVNVVAQEKRKKPPEYNWMKVELQITEFDRERIKCWKDFLKKSII
jgi:hypothetical protein